MPKNPPFNKILIANRGEIAVRLMRACKEMGIASVAVYSEADAKALHVKMADEAVLIGTPAPKDSYLNSSKILAAAKESGAEAIHPGYGFLSENASFAKAVADAGLVFIGPSPKAIKLMGDKGAARKLMEEVDVPLIPGYQGADDLETLTKVAEKIGYPVLLKAAAGGGGKGMRVVARPEELSELLDAARREAQNAFGDQRIILEKFLANSRHIEIQILADQHGNILHLFERECSIQRRHQKVIEETPSPLLDEGLRGEMAQAAIAVAEAVDYTNAGTVEFIVDPETRDFYFLEMNTRLQVEHPITELVTGLDLAQWQIRIAAGERLPFEQDELKQSGHAIEARIYAEDPANTFLPSTGKLHHFRVDETQGVRLDSGVVSGDEVGVYYDPLLAKVIAHAEDRGAAIIKLKAALAESVVLGLDNNRAFLVDVLGHPTFVDGSATTHFIEDYFDDWQAEMDEVPDEVLIVAALSEFHTMLTQQANDAGPENAETDPYSPWARYKKFRLGEGGK